ncbi:hypothetical protein BRC71_06260 [Halobacteriales archaeon QH_7_65_31]|nr:MAG: hypothetical protein BRC71_06260 [Halobacteriales archaeon QH_7_65_31]
MSRKRLNLREEHARTVENALDAVDADEELPDVDRGRGRTSEGEISTGEAVALIAEAYTGWSADE